MGVSCLFALLGSCVSAQEPHLYHPLSGQAIAPAPGGGVYVAGVTEGSLGPNPEAGKGAQVGTPIAKQDSDVFLAHLDASGHIVWLRQFGGEADDGMSGLAVAGNGDLVVVGGTSGDLRTVDDGEPDGSAYVARFTAGGELLWLTQFGLGQRDYARGVAVNEAGEAFVVGWLTTNEQSPSTRFVPEPFWYSHAFLAKLDPEGEITWLRRIVLDADQVASNVILSADGEPVVTGWTASEFPQGGQVHVKSGFVAWFNDKGQLQRIKRDLDPYAMVPFPLAGRPDGGLFVGGMLLGPFERDFEPGSATHLSLNAALASLDADGTSEWARLFGNGSGYWAYDVELTPDLGVVMVGSGNGDVGGDHIGASDVFVISYDSVGNRRWANRFGTKLFDGATAVTRSDDRYFVTGYLSRSWEDPYGRGEFWFVAALSDEGELLWLRQYENQRHYREERPMNAANPSAGREVVLLPDGGALVAGVTHGSMAGRAHHGGADVFLARFSPEGELLWLEQFGAVGDDEVLGLAVGPEGGIRLGVGGEGSATLYELKDDPEPRVVATELEVDAGWSPSAMGFGGLQEAEQVVYLTGSTPNGDTAEPSWGSSERQALNDVFVAAYERGGGRLWSATVAVDADQRAHRVLVIPDAVLVLGNAQPVAVGHFTAAGRSNEHAFMAAFDPAGRLLGWEAFGDSARATGTGRLAGVVGPHGELYVTGRTRACSPFGRRDYEWTLTRLCNPEGFVARFSLDWLAAAGVGYGGSAPSSLVWAVAHGDDLGNEGVAISLMPSGEILLVGSGIGAGRGGLGPSTGTDVLLMKFTPDGQRVSATGFGSLSTDVAYGVAVGPQGQVVVTGQYGGDHGLPERLGYAWFVAAYSPEGEQSWLYVAAAE